MTPVSDVTRIEKDTRPWVCRRAEPGCTRTRPCKACVGARSRRKGKRKQSVARKAIEAQTGTQAVWAGKLAHEETFDHLPVRVEVKAGKSVGPVFTRYLSAEIQSETARAVGDLRPFVFLAMPDGVGDGLVVFRLSKLAAVVEALSA